ncbi:MAG: hypothetical protein H7Y18_13380 [Clostridiaceae bacterium]|nr:hypothetical protein [Clostridiaceae bacterium]
MKILKFLSMFLIMLPLVITGCNNTDMKTNTQVEIELRQLNLENDKLKEQLSSSSTVGNTNKNMIDEENYRWAKEEEWDKILVYKSGFSNDKIEIKEKVFMKNIYFENLMLQQSEPPNGPQSDVEYYTYEFIKGDKTYKVNVVGRDTIEYAGGNFLTNKYIYNLGKSLLPRPKFIITDSVINKIYESGALHGEREFNYLVLNSFRIHGFANALQDGISKGDIVDISKSPVNFGDMKEKFTFYYYGEKIHMEVYQNYLCIKDGNKTYWYKYESELLIFTILSAG